MRNWKEDLETWLKENQKVLDPRAYLIGKHVERYIVFPLHDQISDLEQTISDMTELLKSKDDQLYQQIKLYETMKGQQVISQI